MNTNLTPRFAGVALSMALSIALAGCVVGQTTPSANAAPLSGPSAVSPSFDTALPAPRAPFDTTPITAVETVGASRTE